MTGFSYGVVKVTNNYPAGPKSHDRNERRERRLRAIDEGCDVGGPRWRIGWGGLSEPKSRDNSGQRQ